MEASGADEAVLAGTQGVTQNLSLREGSLTSITPAGTSRKDRLVGDALDELCNHRTALRDRDSARAAPVNTPPSSADSFTPHELAAWRGLLEVHARFCQ